MCYMIVKFSYMDRQPLTEFNLDDRDNRDNRDKELLPDYRFDTDHKINSTVAFLLELQNATRKSRDLQSDHIAMILDYDIIGRNSLRSVWSGSNYGTHAEVDAINKLPLNPTKRIIPIDIVVIRSTSDGTLKISKPCEKCLRQMRMLPSVRRYRVRKIYYSNDEGNLTSISFQDLYEADDKYSCKRFSKKNVTI